MFIAYLLLPTHLRSQPRRVSAYSGSSVVPRRVECGFSGKVGDIHDFIHLIAEATVFVCPIYDPALCAIAKLLDIAVAKVTAFIDRCYRHTLCHAPIRARTAGAPITTGEAMCPSASMRIA